MHTSHQSACLFRCWPAPVTLHHNGSSVVSPHLSSSNWVFLSLLVFQSVIFSHFHTHLSPHFFYVVLTLSIFQRAGCNISTSPSSFSFTSSSFQLLSSLLSISREIHNLTGPSHFFMFFPLLPKSPSPSLSDDLHC